MESRHALLVGGITVKELGNARLVRMYFNFLVRDYKMNFYAQVLPNVVGVEEPTYIRITGDGSVC